MAGSKKPSDGGFSAIPSARTPGSLGRFDAGQPDFIARQGDTPGPLGTNGDAASQNACYVPRPITDGPTIGAAPAGANTAGDDQDVEVWVFPTKTFIQILSTVAGYTSAAKDTLTVKTLWEEFGLTGRYYLKMYGSREHIIFKGAPGLRNIFKGTKYLSDNTKVLGMGIGRAGVIESGVKGCKLTVVLVTAVDIVEFFLRDDETLSQLGVKLFSDLTKSIISAAIGTAVAALVATAGAAIVVPLAVSIAVGVMATKGLDYLDEKFKLTEKLQEWVDKQTSAINQVLNEARRTLNDAGRLAADTIEMLIRLKRDYDRLQREFNNLRRLFSIPIPSL